MLLNQTELVTLRYAIFLLLQSALEGPIIRPARFLLLVFVGVPFLWHGSHKVPAKNVCCTIGSGNYTKYFYFGQFSFSMLFVIFLYFSVLSSRTYLDTIQMTSIFICHFPYTINQTPKADKSVPNTAFKNRFFKIRNIEA